MAGCVFAIVRDFKQGSLITKLPPCVGKSGETVDGILFDRVVKIDPLVLSIVGVEGNPKKSAFPRKFFLSHLDRDRCDHLDPAGFGVD